VKGYFPTRIILVYTIRACITHNELAACVRLQQMIWKYADLEVYPFRLFVTLSKIGGQVIGAFTGAGKMVGFVASIPAWRDGRRYYHSLSLGVLPAHENRGLGRALKLKQRELAMRAGIELIEWTFDPLRAKNAFFNVVRLGAICRRYIPNHYGEMQSQFQQGLASDRLVAEWWLKSPRVLRAIAGKAARIARYNPAAAIAIPARIDAVRKSSPATARALQRRVREQFESCFSRTFVVTDFEVAGDTARYLLDY
jgi:predicted GNAT superfamily acetyltransferase